MNDLEMMQQAIRANPHDWDAYSVCADLLDDAGQARRARYYRSIGQKRGQPLSLIEFAVMAGYGKWSSLFRRSYFYYPMDGFCARAGLYKNEPKGYLRTQVITVLPKPPESSYATWTLYYRGSMDTTINPLTFTRHDDLPEAFTAVRTAEAREYQKTFGPDKVSSHAYGLTPRDFRFSITCQNGYGVYETNFYGPYR